MTSATGYNVKRSTANGGPYTTVSSPGTNSYINTGLTAGSTYYYVVSAVLSGIESFDSTQVSATLIPAVPTGLGATAGDTQVALSWTASAGATAYNVKRSTTNGSGYATVSSPATNNYTNTGLTNGTTYYYVVTAVNGGGESANSSQVSATPEPPIPATPTGLAATPGDTQVALSWTASSGATTYNVKRSTTNGSGYATVSSPGTNSYTNTGLTNGTTYYYVVTAVNGGGESANSSQVSATPEPPIPATPTGLAATPGNAQASLTWTASSGATTYNVKRSTISGSGYATVASPATNSYIDTGLTNGATYYYVVSAVNGGGESANSSEVSATLTPSAPTGLAATAGDTQVALSWTASTGATTYNVKRSTTSGSGYSTVSSPGTNSSTDTSLTNGTVYYYVVSAVNATGESANSSQASATPEPNTLPSAPADLTAQRGQGLVLLTWTVASYAASYNIKRSTVMGGPYTTINSPAGTATSYLDTGLTNGTTYYYVMSSVNWVGESSNTSEVSATPAVHGSFMPQFTHEVDTFAFADAPWLIDIARDDSTTGYEGTDLGGIKIASRYDLSGNTTVVKELRATWWTNSTNPVDFFVGFSSSSDNSTYTEVFNTITTTTNGNGSMTSVMTVNQTQNYWEVTVGSNDGDAKLYDFRLIDPSGNDLNPTPPAAPTGLSATAGSFQVALSWTAATGADTYNIYRGTTSGGESLTAIATGVTSASYTDTGLTSGITYYYKVSALTGIAEGAKSSEASATPTP